MTGMVRSLASITAAALLLAAVQPAAAQETPEPTGEHTVKRGDTLWDLAGRYLSDPLRWSEIFQLNPAVVEDPHWIYPGELLRIPGAPADGAAVAVNQGEVGPDGAYPENSLFRRPRGAAGRSLLEISERPLLPVVSASDFRRAPLLLPEGGAGAEGMTVRVLSENPLDLALPSSAGRFGEVVVGLGGLAPALGDTLKAVRWGRYEEGYGHVLSPKALLRVDRLWADSARATVVALYGDYSVGDPVVAVDPYDLEAETRASEVESGMEGRVVGFEVPQVLIGNGEMLFLDRGLADDVRLGDEFAVFSRSETESLLPGAIDALVVARVVHLTQNTSTAIVTQVRDPGARPGDPVRLVKRMP